MSNVNTLHAENVLENHKVSLAIADPNRNSSGEKFGIQGRGICEKVGEKKCLHLLKMWNIKFQGCILTSEDMKRRNSSFFKIIPIKLKYFNSNFTEKVLEFDF